MSERDYQRGLRGESLYGLSGQRYKDWYAGYTKYEIKNGTYSPITESDRNRWWKEDKEKAFKDAEDMEWGTIFSIAFFAFLLFIAECLVIIFLEPLFGIKIPTAYALIIPVIMVVGTIWSFASENKKKYIEAEKKYGKRD